MIVLYIFSKLSLMSFSCLLKQCVWILPMCPYLHMLEKGVVSWWQCRGKIELRRKLVGETM